MARRGALAASPAGQAAAVGFPLKVYPVLAEEHYGAEKWKGSAVFSRAAVGAIVALLAGPGQGAVIQGTVVVTHRLTRQKVTIESGVYDRGAVAPLEPAQPQDALAFERTHVAVFLEGPLPGFQRSAGLPAPVMAQRNRAFLPDMLVVPAGSEVSFPNLDPIFHNVFSLSGMKSFDLGNYPIHQTRNVTMPKPGVVIVNCRLHPNMSGVIVVTPNAWATRPAEDGQFTLPDAPPGKYTVVAWHKAVGFVRKEIAAGASDDVHVEFVLPLAGPGDAAQLTHPASERR
jgi:plastocyanin